MPPFQNSINPTLDEAYEIANFVLDNSDLYKPEDRDYMARYIFSHMKFGTMMCVRDKDSSIVAACRWNWVDYHTAKILDLVVRKDFRNKNVLKKMLIRAKRAYPQGEFIIFSRKKYRHREVGYMISDWLKKRS